MSRESLYRAALLIMEMILPPELINIITRYVAHYNLEDFCTQHNIPFAELNKFLIYYRGLIRGKCLFECLLNRHPKAIKIIVPSTDLGEDREITISFYNKILCNNQDLLAYPIPGKHIFYINHDSIEIKYIQTPNYISKNYNISIDQITYNGNTFNFPLSDLGPLIHQPRINIGSISKKLLDNKIESKKLNLNIIYKSLYQLYNEKERSDILSFLYKWKTGQNRSKDTGRIIKYMIDGYRIDNTDQLITLINK
jgi:hypothetical protein